MCNANGLPAWSQPTRCFAARTGSGEISQAGKHTSSKRRCEYTTRNKMKNMLYFVETTHEVAETVIFRQYVPVDIIPSIRECNSSNTARTPKNISDVCTAAAVDTACARGSVLLMTYYWYTRMSTYKGIVCLTKRTHRYSREAPMNVLYVEQYHTTFVL